MQLQGVDCDLACAHLRTMAGIVVSTADPVSRPSSLRTRVADTRLVLICRREGGAEQVSDKSLEFGGSFADLGVRWPGHVAVDEVAT